MVLASYNIYIGTLALNMHEMKIYFTTYYKRLKENFTFFYSLPLPPFEHIGTLNIKRQTRIGSRMKLMTLPVEDRKLSVKVLVNWFCEISLK